MKKLALALMAASAAMFGFGMVAEAQTYDPSVSVGTVTPGGAYTATYTNCVAGETITFSQPESTPTTTTGVCSASRVATGTFTNAPTAPGTYTVTASGPTSPARTIVFSLAAAPTTVPATVPGGGLPATGSSGMGTTGGMAIGLLVVGLGLFAVAQVRRRQPSAA